MWTELELRENALLTAKADLVSQESRLFQWAEDLKTRELLLDERERSIMLVTDATPSVASSRGVTTNHRADGERKLFQQSFNDTGGNASPSVDVIEEQRRQLVDVADYLERRSSAVEALKAWVEERAAVIEDVLSRLEAVHGLLPQAPGPRVDISPLRDDIHPLLQLVTGASSFKR